MIFTETKIPGVFVIELERRSDERGFFARQWCADEFTRAGLDPRVAQINTARSVKAGTLRGCALSESAACRGQARALYPRRRIRRRWSTCASAARLSVNGSASSSMTNSGRMLYIPEGCGHGYLTLAPNTDLVYQASVPYAPGSATGVRHDDPAFNIVWPSAINVISSQDQNWPSFSARI